MRRKNALHSYFYAKKFVNNNQNIILNLIEIAIFVAFMQKTLEQIYKKFIIMFINKREKDVNI